VHQSVTLGVAEPAPDAMSSEAASSATAHHDGPDEGVSRTSHVVRARREATQRALVEATEALLATRSFGEVTVEDVMSSAGLTRTAFYRYFPDLEAVLLAGLVDIREELAAAAARWLDPDADPDNGLEAAATGLAEVYQRHGRMLLAFAEAATGGGAVQAAWHDAVEAFVEPVRQRLDAVGGGRLPHSGEAARALVWMNERYLLETYGRGREVPPEVAGTVLAYIWRGALRVDA
jgi:AcrR family transcriptional regulator